MKKILVVLIFLLSTETFAQHKFIKTLDDPAYGRLLRILPTSDMGWVIFSLDSLKLTKFNNCGGIEWNRNYTLPSCLYHGDFIKTQSGGFALLSSLINGSKYSSLITTFDASGNVIWSKVFDDPLYSQYPYTINLDAQGNFVFYSNVSSISGNTLYNMICKVDVNGNTIWTKFYDHGGIWGGAITTSDNGTLIRTGQTFIKTDQLGNVQWTSKFNTTSAYYYAPIEVSDGYIFTGASSGTQNIGFYKMDLMGNLLWGGERKSNYTGQPPLLRKKTNGNITGIFNITSAGNTDPIIIEFDKDLNVINKNMYMSGNNLLGKDMCFLNNGTPVITGLSNTTLYPFYIKSDQLYRSDCDNVAAAPQFSLNVLTQPFINTNAISNTLNTSTVNITAVPFPLSESSICNTIKKINIGKDTLICQGQILQLKNHTGDTFDHYLWSTGDTTSSIHISHPGTYWLIALDYCDPSSLTDTVKITIKPAVTVDLGVDVIKCEDVPLVLNGANCSACSYTWSTGSNLSSIEITKKGIYWLKVDNNNGCQYTDSINVENSKCECTLYMPDAFTPNNDGLNDEFKPIYDCDLQNYSLEIFDRWGHLIFRTNDIETSWNGTTKNEFVQLGVYVYQITYQPIIKGVKGSTLSKSGKVVVIY
ncbi:MAG: gliding motility-associated C-terminal domain-containing protein [Bacteroidota bacterium]